MTVSTTRVDEIADGLYRIHTPVSTLPGGFRFNQYLLVDSDILEPRTLACMHGSAWRGDGAELLREPAGRLAAGPAARSDAAQPDAARHVRAARGGA